MSTIISARVEDQALLLLSVPKIASGGANECRVEVLFDDTWMGYQKLAVFYRNKNKAYHVIMKDDTCIIPHEVLAEAGRVYVGILGISGSITRTTEVVALAVSQGAITGVQAPSPDVYKQVLIECDRLARKLEAETARLDNLLGSVTEGSTTLDAEIIDARMDDDGHAYPNLGAAMRAHSDKTLLTLGRFVELNKLNPDSVADGYIAPNGVFHASADYMYTDYIPLEKGETVHLYNKNMSVMEMRFVAACDADKQALPALSGGPFTGFTQSDNIAYIRVSILKTHGEPETLMIGGPNRSTFTPYHRDDVNTSDDSGMLRNLFNSDDAVLAHYCNYTNGVVTPEPAYNTSAIIPVTPGKTYSLFKRSMEKIMVRMWCFYDEKGNFLSGGVQDTFITIPDGVHLMRFCTQVENGLDLMFTETDCGRFLEAGDVCLRDKAVPQPLYRKGGYYYANMGDITNDVVLFPGESFPWYTRKNTAISALVKFDSFLDMTFGRGRITDYGTWVDIRQNSIDLYTHTNSATPEQTFTGVPIEDYLYVRMETDDESQLTITVASKSATVSHTIDASSLFMGFPFVGTKGTLKNVEVRGGCSDLTRPVWLLGDSYLGLTEDRLMHHVRELGCKNYAHIAIGGLKSTNGYAELLRCLNYNKPSVLVWYLGMNDAASTFGEYLEKVKRLCETFDIELIINRVPTVPNINKEEHSATVIASGLRYIDSYAAVGSNASGEWASGYLSGDNVHPNAAGSRVLAARIIMDVPELMSY